MNKARKDFGFTLLELLGVVIIIGILTSLAWIAFTKTIEEARVAEAISILGAIRAAELTYYQVNENYTNVETEIAVDIPPNDSLLHYFKYRTADALDITVNNERTPKPLPQGPRVSLPPRREENLVIRQHIG